MRRVIDTENGITSVHHGIQDGKRVIEMIQDASKILDQNKRLANEGKGYSPSKDLQRIASIPNIVTLKWLHEDGVYWPKLPKLEATKYLRKKLNDPQWRYLRTSEGSL